MLFPSSTLKKRLFSSEEKRKEKGSVLMKERNFGIITILTVLFAVILILCTKTNLLTKIGVATDGLNETQIEETLNEIDNGKRLVIVYNVSHSEFNHFIDVVFDTPDFFWIDLSHLTFSIGDINVLYLREKYNNIDEKKEQIKNKVQSIVEATVDDSMSEYEKVLAIHDWICENVSYGSLANSGDQDIYGALFSKISKCAGYSKLFTVLLREVGIQSEVISGDAIDTYTGSVGAHAWNLVYIDENPYYFDITWNDNDAGKLTYRWFGVTSNEFKTKHFPSDGYEWVETDHTEACYYIKNGMYVENYNVSYVIREIQRQGKEFTIKCSSLSVLNAFKEALEKQDELQKIMRGTGITYIDRIISQEEDAVNCLTIKIQ